MKALQFFRTGIFMLVSFVAGLASNAAFSVDLTLNVKTLNLETATYQVGGVQATTSGASATTPVGLVLTGLSEGTHTLGSSFGKLQFTVDAGGDVVAWVRRR